LVGHVSFIGGNFDPVQKAIRQTERDGGGAGFQVGQAHAFGLAPIDMACGVIRFPKGAFFGFGLEWERKGTLPFSSCNLPVSKIDPPSVPRSFRSFRAPLKRLLTCQLQCQYK
jgi:hypothetical protein